MAVKALVLAALLVSTSVVPSPKFQCHLVMDPELMVDASVNVNVLFRQVESFNVNLATGLPVITNGMVVSPTQPKLVMGR